MRPIRVLLAVGAMLVWAPAAVAKQYAPPGKAGTSQYAEDIPTAGGNAATPAMGGGNKTPAEINRLGNGKAGVRKLSKMGDLGGAAARWAQETAPATTSGTTGRTHAGLSSSGRTRAGLSSSGGSALHAVGDLLGGSDGGGIGVFLPLLLAFGLGWAGAVAAIRMRRGRDPGAPQS